MAKFILSVGDSTFKILESEAKKRDVTVQQLLRAVIVPEWARDNLEISPSPMAQKINAPSMPQREIAPHLMHQSIYPSQHDPTVQAPHNRLRS